MALDSHGNVYVTGTTDSTLGFFNWMTIKYAPNGTVKWKQRYTSEDKQDDEAYKVVVDSKGNVYVGGVTYGLETLYDFVVIKYDSNGVQQWLARYNGPDSDYDLLTSLAVDSSGNVYAAGGSSNINGFYDYLTIKYNSDGVQQWLQRYDGYGGLDDGINGMALDALGNVYVTGFSNSGTSPDAVTIKYNSDGVQQWIMRYDGPDSNTDEAYEIKTDAKNNVYVVGYSHGPNAFDYLTIKYSQFGDERWVARYDGGGNYIDVGMAIGVDTSGNVVVGGRSYGSSGGGFDCATVKYDSNGVQQWSQTEDFGVQSEVVDLALDPMGNVLVAGSINPAQANFLTIKYSANGTKLWAAEYDGPAHLYDVVTAVATDLYGNTFVAGVSQGLNTYSDYAVLKYSPGGSQQWVQRYNGVGSSDDQIGSMKVDWMGNMYLAINSRAYPDSGQQFIMVTVKLSPSGDTLWTRRYYGAYLGGMNLDSAGNIYVSGASYSVAHDIITVKYSPEGLQLWAKTFTSSFARFSVTSVGIDKLGNAYVGGYAVYDTTGHGPNYSDFVVLKYTSAGALLWSSEHSNNGNGAWVAGNLAIDGTNGVIMTGYGSPGGLTTKWDANGTKKWDAVSAGNPSFVAVDRLGNSYVTGSQTLKYDSNGGLLWSIALDGRFIAVDDELNAYVVGYYLIKYLPNGTQAWDRIPLVGDGDYFNVQVDKCGNVYTVNLSPDSLRAYKYGPNGQLKWRYSTMHFNRPGGGFQPFLELDRLGQVYIAQSASLGLGFGFQASYAIKLQPIPSMAIAADTISFGSVSLSCTLADTTTLTTSVCATSDAFSVSSSDSAFTVTPIGPSVNSSSTVHQYRISFHPSTTGPKTSMITFVHNGSNVSSTLVVSGTGVSGYPEYSAQNIQFDDAAVGCKQTRTLTIKNLRCVPLNLKAVLSSGFDFIVDPESAVVAPKDSVTLAISFIPLAVGQRTAHVLILHNQKSDPDSLLVGGLGLGTGSEVAITDSFGLGWQLISSPVVSSCLSVFQPSFTFIHGYVRHDTLDLGHGYWNKLKRPSLSFAGAPVTSVSFTVEQGWNIVGSISDPILASALQTVPSGIIQTPLYGLSPVGDYQIADSIEPGHAYWLKTSQTGTMTMAQSIQPLATQEILAPRAPSMNAVLKNANKIYITDSAGHSRTLYFTMEHSGAEGTSCFELPPPPPLGGFDVRFASGRMVELIQGISRTELPILTTGVTYPLHLRFELRGSVKEAVIQVGSAQYALAGNAEIMVTGPGSPVKLKFAPVAPIPNEFGLSQNYPNPFNPSTTIAYALPTESKVLLTIYNTLGQRVRTLVDGVESPGFKRVTLDASDLTSGVYFYRIQAGSFSDSKKLILMR